MVVNGDTLGNVPGTILGDHETDTVRPVFPGISRATYDSDGFLAMIGGGYFGEISLDYDGVDAHGAGLEANFSF